MYVSYRLNKVYNEADVDNYDGDGGGGGGGGCGGGCGVGVVDDAGAGTGAGAGAGAADDDYDDRTLNLPRNFFMSTGNSKNTSQKFLMTG